MDLFRMKYAKVGIYCCDSKKYPRKVTRVGIIKLRRDYPLLNDELTPLIAKKYTDFFVNFLTEMEGINGEFYRGAIEREILLQSKNRLPLKPLDRAKLKALKKQKRPFRERRIECIRKAYPNVEGDNLDFIIDTLGQRKETPPETKTDEEKAKAFLEA